VSSPHVVMKHALRELCTASEQLRAVEHLMDQGGEDEPDDEVAVQVEQRYLQALENAMRLST